MKLRSFIILLALAIGAMSMVVMAKDNNQGQAMMQPPPEPAQLGKLDFFAGKWQGAATLTMMGQTMKGEVTHETSKLPFGWGYETKEICKIADMKSYEATDLFGYDMGDGKFHMYTISNYGDTHDHAGTWTDDKHLVLEYDGMMEGKKFVEKLPITVDSPDQYSVNDTVFIDGQVNQVFTATMKRVGK